MTEREVEEPCPYCSGTGSVGALPLVLPGMVLAQGAPCTACSGSGNAKRKVIVKDEEKDRGVSDEVEDLIRKYSREDDE